MPVMSLGLMRSMHSWQDMDLADIPAASQKRLAAIVERALAIGITHLETARGYGSSERQLGRVLADYQRDRFILQTKIPPHADTDRFVADFHDSLDRLGVEYVDLLAIHGINDHRSLWETCRPGGCLAAARRLQAAGKVRFVGFSGHGDTDVLLAAVEHQDDGGFDYLNLHWYYIFQQHRPVLETAAEHDLGVFVISPSDKGGMLQDPPPLLRDLCQPLHPMQFNDLFCLSRPAIHTISLGASRPEDFDLHVAILPELDNATDLIATVDRRLGEAMQAATGNRRPDALWDRLPPWDRVPGHINLRLIVWLYNLARGWQLTAYARSRYRKIGIEIPWVPGAPAAHLDAAALRRCLERHGLDAEHILTLLADAHRLLAAQDPEAGENRRQKNKKA